MIPDPFNTQPADYTNNQYYTRGPWPTTMILYSVGRSLPLHQPRGLRARVFFLVFMLIWLTYSTDRKNEKWYELYLGTGKL